MSASVDIHPYGFVVTTEGYEDATRRVAIAWDRSGTPVVFHARHAAEEFARTWDSGDTVANHHIAERWGKRYA